jgi:hypothetical protein
MKAVVKFIAVIVILNAATHVALASWRHFQLRDTAEQAVTFGASQDPGVIKGNILKRAAELDLPVSTNDVVVSRNGKLTTANATYTQAIELFPSYTYPYAFSFKVESNNLAGLR